MTSLQWLAGLSAFCVAVVLPLINSYWKNRRDSKSDEISQNYLRTIAESNVRMADKQGELNVMLRVAQEVGDLRHQQNLEAMRTLCKADCPSYFPEKPQSTINQKQTV